MEVPIGMTSHVHEFDAREGGSFQISLTYDAQAGTGKQSGLGKTTAHSDTYRGSFAKLVTNEQVVEIVEFETTDPAESFLDERGEFRERHLAWPALAETDGSRRSGSTSAPSASVA